MTYQELKKAANGWEVADSETDDSRAVGGDIRLKRYNIKELVHSELDQFKVELYHYYCPKCAGRQGQVIRKEVEYDEISKEVYCQKHKEQLLEVKQSGLYDSDYDLPVKEREITYQAMIDSPKGWRKIPYKGALSENQLKKKNRLNQSYPQPQDIVD